VADRDSPGRLATLGQAGERERGHPVRERHQLGKTGKAVTVDQDEVQVSFGFDGDEIDCWTCGDATFESGVYVVQNGPRVREAERGQYERERYPDLVDDRTKTLTCGTCSVAFQYTDPRALRFKVKTV
jgi:hypothetical protein